MLYLYQTDEMNMHRTLQTYRIIFYFIKRIIIRVQTIFSKRIRYYYNGDLFVLMNSDVRRKNTRSTRNNNLPPQHGTFRNVHGV